MNLIELKMAKALFAGELKKLEGINVNCGSCENWGDRKCQSFDQVPPMEVQATGCDSWKYDWVPF